MNEKILEAISGVAAICGFSILWNWMKKTEREIDETARSIEESRKQIQEDMERIERMANIGAKAVEKSGFEEYLEFVEGS